MVPNSPGVSPFVKTAYGIGNISYSLPYQIMASFFIFYATAILKLPASWAATAMAVSAVWDAVTDPLMGFISDNSYTKNWGRRHPFLLFGALVIAFATYFLWSIDPAAGEISKFVQVVLWLLVLRTALTVFVAPYNALGAELSNDYDERSSVQGYRATFYIIGMIIALVGTMVVFFHATPQYDRGQLNPAAYPKMAWVYSIFVLLTMIAAFWGTRKFIPGLPQRSAVMESEKISVRRIYTDFLNALKNHDFLMVALLIFIIEVGFQLGIAIGVHVNTYAYHLSGPQMGILGLVILGFSILSQPFWIWFTKKYDKKWAVIVGMVIGLTGFVGAPWTHIWWPLFPLNTDTIILSLGAFNVLAGIGNGAFMSIPYSMVADTVDAEEVYSGKRDEGLYFGIYTFAYKLGTSISVLLSGFVLTWSGFNPQLSEQIPSTVFYMALIPTWFLVALAPFALWTVLRYRLSRGRYQEIQVQLVDKNRG